MIKRLVLVRHGQGRHQTDSIVGGWTDIPLTERGRKQASQLGQRLKSLKLGDKVIVSSDIARAEETARIIARILGCEVILNEGAREIHQGISDGMDRSEARRKRKQIEGSVLDWKPFEGAETWREFDKRIADLLGDLMSLPQQTIILVSHFQTTVSLIQNWLGLVDDQKESVDFRIDNCSLSILEGDGISSRFIRTLNDISHLEFDHDANLSIRDI